ncbi:hypothetical protein N7478_008715 [Penicillium angulare]|uniref:uncharacterized protein n=1 Tax=Penicillium angulare TaxID=116970 RepID=UPI00254234C9|nr:uncharacterized protein N7478_008715 [Penicillium angulare]KAJ5273590.1 hypothetical protein N7478_008715 [Penicillium angulare]
MAAKISTAPGDIYPVHVMDDGPANHCYVNWMMHFNDIIEATKLNEALVKLLEKGDWKKLGGRLRRNKSGKLEIHALDSSDPEQKSVFFTHNTFDMTIDKHPVASRLPKETHSPSVQPLHDAEFRPLIARENLPTFHEMVEKDLPSVSLHVTSFNDGTFVGLAWPHVLMDAIGAKDLLAAWSLVLSGQEESVLPVLGAKEDFLRKTDALYDDNETPEEFGLEKHRLAGMGLVVFVVRFLWSKLWSSRRQRKVVFIPRDAFAKMKVKAQEDVTTTSQEVEDQAFISSSDILTAWFTRAVALSERKSRQFTVLNLLNARFRLPILVKSSGVFLGNMVLGTYSFLSSQLGSKGVGSIALEHRKHCTEQGTAKQTVCFLESILRDVDSGGTPRLIFGEPWARVVAFNNLLKADVIRTVDFSAAVIRPGDVSEKRKNSSGTMLSYFNGDIDQSFKDLDIFVVLGQDHEENYWVLGCVFPRVWQKIEQELRSIETNLNLQ